ncbi:hypothetical protein F442_03106 [Phytophthora nicotianae P10297]|uniref:HAT C-terminal dimerisation domain-containing protein n=1 Tax=Phytophthora nicotianae P10297 TaxID=1317064 RepID=W2ZXZ6_PHYNI|nr:hypothetical protein F442_03106 [Phytophthora nicotianae P10297]
MLSSGGSREIGTVSTRVDGELRPVPAPELIRDYHRWMGDVGVHDQLRMQHYSVQLSYKSRKYYRILVLGLLDMALVKVFIVHRYHRKEATSARERTAPSPARSEPTRSHRPATVAIIKRKTQILSTVSKECYGAIVHAKLNRAVQHELQEHEADLAEVQALMIKLRTLTQSAKLRLKTDLRSVIRQDTRWRPTFMMQHRYFELLKHLDTTDDEIADLPTSASCNRRLRALLKELTDVESVSKALQGTNVDLLDVREWFGGLIVIKPQYADYLGPRSAIVHSPDFESGCAVFEVTSGERPANEDVEGSFVERVEKRRRLAQQEQRYVLLRSVLPTSNMVERFFSIARTTFGHERNGLQPITLEQVLFLR